jgi:[protein-PII] uridylyltransferase
MHHARCLLQFNQYHKYTVDEHSLRAVRKASEFADRPDALGQAYKEIRDKRVLHLALLLHDLGKGFEEDHSEVGRRIALETCRRFELDEHATVDVVFLVHKHLLMAHSTFRRDMSDPAMLKQFAEEVGSVERLKMLFVLTCADLAAVGPGVLNDWKVEVLGELFSRACQLLQEGSEAAQGKLIRYRAKLLEMLEPAQRADAWFVEHLEALPASFLASSEPEEALDALRRFRQLSESGVEVWHSVQEETQTAEFTAGVFDGVGRGVFSRMAGALSAAGLAILSADTDALPGRLLMLRYTVCDPQSSQALPLDRLERVRRAMVQSVESEIPPVFPRVWGQEKQRHATRLTGLPNEVRIDNQLSANYTIVEVFTFDRQGLLYSLARKLHELELVIRHAKIGTYLDQVVDVFYVNDRQDRKLHDEGRLAHIRAQLLEVIHRED